MKITNNYFVGPMGNAISAEPMSHLHIQGNHIKNLGDGGIGIVIHPVTGLADDPVDIEIVGNTIWNEGTVSGLLTDYGIALTNCRYALVEGNIIKRMGRAGILVRGLLTTSSANVCKDIDVIGNKILDSNQDNAATTPSVHISQGASTTVSDIRVIGNDLRKINSDSNATHGILEEGAITDGEYEGNDVRGAITAGIAFGSGTTSRAFRNKGYNPQGALAVTPGASPWTYTAGPTPEVLHLRGGTVSLIVKNSVTLYVATPASIPLEPREAVVVTYSVVPTAVTDRK